MFERSGRKEVTFEASREIAKPKTMLKPRKVGRQIPQYLHAAMDIGTHIVGEKSLLAPLI